MKPGDRQFRGSVMPSGNQAVSIFLLHYPQSSSPCWSPHGCWKAHLQCSHFHSRVKRAKNKDTGLVPGKKSFPRNHCFCLFLIGQSCVTWLPVRTRESRKKNMTLGHIVHSLPLSKSRLSVRKKRNVDMMEISNNICQISLFSVVS